MMRLHGMIFIGHWGPEQGHDPIVSELVDGLLIAMHFLRQNLKAFVHERIYALDLELFRQCCQRCKTGSSAILMMTG
jgi:hypothetical protein